MARLRQLRKPFFLLILLGFFISAHDAVGSGRVLESDSWKQIESRHVIIQYKQPEDIRNFDESINFSPGKWSLKDLFSSTKPEDRIHSVIRKLDGIFEKVQNILDMRKKTKKVTLKVYPSTTKLHEAYFAITGMRCNYKAWYIFESNTIYVTVDNVNEGIIAHEMAHSIIDHYFSVRPPRATAEILSRYVDQHLDL